MSSTADEEAFIAALQNAHAHGGSADAKPVMGRLMAKLKDMPVSEAMRLAGEAVRRVNTLTREEQEVELRRLAPQLLAREKKERVSRLRELADAGAGFTVRLAPYPSGAPHIGNTRMFILNDEYAKRYSGRLLLVFDDTIGSEEKFPDLESYALIEDGLRWLGVKWEGVYYKSDRLDIFYSWAEKLIERDIAYVCMCDAETLRGYREKGEACEHRAHTIRQNLDYWRMMISGGFGPGEAVLRAKTDMGHRNPAFRDRVLCRISARRHPRVGDRYRVWPMLEFSWAVDDIELKMTHVIRGKELVMEDMMERFIWDRMALKGPIFEHFGLLRLKGVKISKSKSRAEVSSGAYSGWEDPRTWSLQSLAARGFRPQAIRSFMLSLGMSMADIEVPVDSVYSENRRLLEPEACRYFFVDDPVQLTIDGLEGDTRIESYLHPDRPELGKRIIDAGSSVYVARRDLDALTGGEVRLKDFCNVLLSSGHAKFTGRENREIQRIQWVPAGDNVSCGIMMPDGSLVRGLAEGNVKGIPLNVPIQFERFGFVNPRSRGAEGMFFYFTHE